MTREEWLEPKDWEEPDYMYDDTEAIECWHMLADDGIMGQYEDAETGEFVIAPDIIVEEGATYSMDESPILCVRGYHGSRRLLDTLHYAPGSLCCRVLIGGEIDEGSDKLAGQWRKVLWMKGILALLHEFTCDIAEMTLERCNITDPRCWEAIHAKRRWLGGDATHEEVDQARIEAHCVSFEVKKQDRGAVIASVWAAETLPKVTPFGAYVAAVNFTRYGHYCAEWDEVNGLLEQRVWDAYNGLA